MTKLVDLGDARKARAEKCMFCGEDEHALGPLTCKRIEGVELDPDDGSVIAIHFWCPNDAPQEDPAN